MADEEDSDGTNDTRFAIESLSPTAKFLCTWIALFLTFAIFDQYTCFPQFFCRGLDGGVGK